jgi:predicted Zn-ribbon and HTH transcriptional regulator
MVTRQFICKNCGHKFTAEVFEKEEAEKKGLMAAPLRCPRCNSTSVERI